MPTIVATNYNTPAYVLVEVDWTDQPTVQYVTVWRTNTVTGERVQLRPYGMYDANGNIALSCGLATFWDTEPPLNVPLEYCTMASDVDTPINSNTNFEVALAPWTGGGLGAAVRSNLFAHTGTWSAQFTPGGSAFIPTLLDATGYVIPAGEVTVKAWVFTQQGWNGVFARCDVQGPDLLITTYTSPMYTVYPSTWQLIEFTFDAGGPATILEIEVGLVGKPPNTVILYIDDVTVTQPVAVATEVCDTVTVTSTSLWLKNPIYPCHDVEVGTCSPAMDFDCEEDSRVSYAGMESDDRASNTALSLPVNRKYPVPTSRVRRAPTSQLRLIAHDCDARDAVIATNEPGTPLLFQAPADYCIPDRYISVDVLSEMRFSVDQRDDFRLMILPYAVVAMPQGPANGICGARIMDLCDIYTTWAALTMAGLSYQDLLLGAASNSGPVFPPAAGARTWGDVVTEFADWNAVTGGGSRDWQELRDGL